MSNIPDLVLKVDCPCPTDSVFVRVPCKFAAFLAPKNWDQDSAKVVGANHASGRRQAAYNPTTTIL